MSPNQQPLLTYRVRIGHHDIRVRARDAAEAIVLVRRQLVRELPRLYDVISKLAAAKFQVEHAA